MTYKLTVKSYELHYFTIPTFNSNSFSFFAVQYKTLAGEYKKQPVIFNIDGWWTVPVENSTDKDGVVHEETQHKIYNEV